MTEQRKEYRSRPEVKLQRLKTEREYFKSPAVRAAQKMKSLAIKEALRAYVNSVKAQTPCKDCGKLFPPICMDFDHIHGKSISIADAICQRYCLERIQKEIEKCELVCACCHRLRTETRNQYSPRPDLL